MRTRVNKPFLATVLVLVLTATLLMMASPIAEALNVDTTATVVFTADPTYPDVSVGVKQGDWMEYNVTYIGGDGPEEYPKWIRFHITNIQGTSITADLTFERVNGTISTVSSTDDLKTGVLQFLVVSAGLNVGDPVYHESYENITIDGTESGTYAGSTRTAVHATFDGIKVYWDKATGIFLKSEQILEYEEENVAQIVLISATNVWQEPTTDTDHSGLDSTVLYAIIVAVIAIVAITAFFLIRIKKSGK